MFRDTITLMGEQENGVSGERFGLERKERGRLEKWTRSVLPSGVAVANAAAVRSLSDARRGARHGSAAERGRGRNRLPASAAELGGKKVNLAVSAVFVVVLPYRCVTLSVWDK